MNSRKVSVSLWLPIFFAGLLASLVSCTETRPVVVDKPKIEAYIKEQMPNTTLVRYTFDPGWDEVISVLTLRVSNKGDISFNQPTLKSFTGGGRISVINMGDCHIYPQHGFGTRDPKLPQAELFAKSIPELISRWDEIYAFLNRHSHDGKDESRGIIPGCLRQT